MASAPGPPRPPGTSEPPPTGTFMPGIPTSMGLPPDTMTSMIARATASIETAAESTALPSEVTAGPAIVMTTMSAASIVSVSTVFLFAATTAYLLRMLQPPTRKLDYIVGQVVITIAFLLLVTVFSLTIKISGISSGNFDLTEINRYGYIIDAVTNAQLVVTKFSFALSILSFSKLSKNVRYQRIVKGVVVFQGLYILSVLPHDILCIPLSDVWKVARFVGDAATSTANPHCQNYIVTFYVFATIELVDDIMLLLLPLPVIASLPDRHNRYGTIFLFVLGICVLFADILKLIFIPYVGYSQHSTDKLSPSSRLVWSFVGNHMKSYISLIVACLPQVRVTLVQLFTSRRKHSTNATASAAGSRSPRTGLEKYLIATSSTVVDDLEKPSGDMGFAIQKQDLQTSEVVEITLQPDHDPEKPLLNHASTWNESTTLSDSRRSSELYKAFSDALERRLTAASPPDVPVVQDVERPAMMRNDTEWEQLYPPTAVQIAPFDEQFVSRRTRLATTKVPDSVTSPPSTRSSSEEIVGRSILQKEYFDLVVHRRKQSNNSQPRPLMDQSTLFAPSSDGANHVRHTHYPIDSPTWGVEAPVFYDNDKA